MSALPAEDTIVATIRALLEGDATARRTTRGRVTLGIGDDAALWQPSRAHRSAISTDALVEGVHFAPGLMTWEDVGWRALAASASDLAAMGARPVLATVALGLAPTLTLEDVTALYRGLSAAARSVGMAIVGGDLTRAPATVIVVTVVGEVRASDAKLRSGGLPAAVLALTGPLGAARAGLDVARDPGLLDESTAEAALRAFRRPQAHVAQGRWLAASRSVQAMMDTSDGLSTDLHRLCAASACGATIASVPIAPAARAVAQRLGVDPLDYALGAGEDFELLIAIRARAFAHVARRFHARFKTPLLRVGTLAPASDGVALERDGVRVPLRATGWDHFAS